MDGDHELLLVSASPLKTCRGTNKIIACGLQVNDGPCVTYVGPGGAGNFVKMVHNGIEYGDMQLISEAYDVLRTVGGLSNEEMVEAFNEWNAVSNPSL